MGILTSLYTGISGLAGQGEALAVYGDNIANASTTGFKTSRPEFQDVISKSVKGLLGGNQIGAGMKLSAITPIFSQGSVIQTESPTDLAITGDGFFVLDGTDGRSYTRNGAFRFDREGKLITSDGARVMGFEADDLGKISTKLGPVSVDRSVIDAKKTESVNLFMNLDLRAEKLKEFNIAKPEKTSNAATSVTIYDSAGMAHSCTAYFNKTEDDVWTWHAVVKGDECNNGKPGELVECATGTLTFDTDGRLKDQSISKSQFTFNKGAKPDQVVNFNFGTDKAHGGTGVQVTQYGTNSETYKTIQDGYTAGTLVGFSFSEEGILIAHFSNSESINISQIALTRFENPEGLFKLGQNRFRDTRSSGEANIGCAQTGGRGRISVKALESSTTDIASDFINLIQAQRNFQANGKVISTTDEMLQEVLNIKRG